MHMHVVTAEGREIIFPRVTGEGMANEQFQQMRIEHFPESVPVAHNIWPIKIGLWDQELRTKFADVEWK